MDRAQRHTHNGVDAERLDGSAILNCPLPAVTPLSTKTAGASYTADEQALINSLKTTVNELVAKLQSIHIIQ